RPASTSFRFAEDSILDTGRRRRSTSEQQNRQVVRETFFVGVPFNGLDDAGADGRQALAGACLERRLEADFVERASGWVFGLGDAVAVDRDQIVRFQDDVSGCVR